MQLITLLKKLAYLATMSYVAAYFLTTYSFNSDEALPRVKTFVADSEEITARIGAVTSLDLIKKVSVSAGETTKQHREYTFFAEGVKGRAKVTVLAEQSQEHYKGETLVIKDIH